MKIADMSPRTACDYVRKLFTYDPVTGKLLWAVRRQGGWASPGNEAGSENARGYVTVRLDGHRFAAARIIHLYMTGKWPSNQCRYLNGRMNDLRWRNLSFEPEPNVTPSALYMRDLRDINREIDRRIKSDEALRRHYYGADNLECRRIRAELRQQIRQEQADAIGVDVRDLIPERK